MLIDLSGHTAHNRLAVFAFKPAPVQVSWLGYFATTGVAEIDYLLADPVSVPPQHQDHFTETIWYLPDTRLCFTPPQHAPAVAPLPALANGFVTFGSFQNLAKLNDEVLALWARVLAALPGSRLRLQNKQLVDATSARASRSQRLQHVGIAAERVSLHGPMPRRRLSGRARRGRPDPRFVSLPRRHHDLRGAVDGCADDHAGRRSADRPPGREPARRRRPARLDRRHAGTITSTRRSPSRATCRRWPRCALACAITCSRSPLFDSPRFARNLERALSGNVATSAISAAH